MDGITELQEGERLGDQSRPGEIRWESFVTFVPSGEFEHIIAADGSALVRVGSAVIHFPPGTNVQELTADNQNPGSRRGAPPADRTTEQDALSTRVRSRVISIPPDAREGARVTYIPHGTNFQELRELTAENDNARSRREDPPTEGTTDQDGLSRLAPPAARTTEQDGGRRRPLPYIRTAQHHGSMSNGQSPRASPRVASGIAPNIFELTLRGVQFAEAERFAENGGPREEAPTTARSARSFVDGVPSTSIEESQLDDGLVVCSICLDVMVSGGSFKKLPCLHYYHKDCIMKWVESHSTCPLCRFELPIDNLQHEGYRRNRL